MEIRRFFYSLLRKWWLILILAVLGGGMGFLNGYYTKPIYQADTTLYIMNQDKVTTQLNTADVALSQQLVRQYFDIVYSRAVTSAVSQEVKKYNLSENAILSMVRLTSKVDSDIFTISATGSDPTITAGVANAAGRAFISQIRQLTKSDNVGILDEALVPYTPVNNAGNMKLLLGIFIGLVVAFGIIYIIEYFDNTVRSVEDIEKGLNLQVIGIIPENNI